MACNPTQTDGCSWITANNVVAAASIAVATINTIAAISMQNKQLELARDYWKMARSLHDYYFNYFIPKEKEIIEEAFSQTPYVPKYELEGGRAVAAVNRQFKTVLDDTMRCISRYCTGMKRSALMDYALQQANARADAQNFAYRAEEFRKDAKDDIIWARKKEVVQLGRGLGSEAASYAQVAAGAYGTIGAQAANAAGASMQEAFKRLAPAPNYENPTNKPQVVDTGALKGFDNGVSLANTATYSLGRVSDPPAGISQPTGGLSYNNAQAQASANYAAYTRPASLDLLNSSDYGMFLSGASPSTPSVPR